MKKVIALIAVAMLLLTYAIALSLRETSAIPDTLDAKNHPGFYDYRGAINVQTSLSHGFLTRPKRFARGKIRNWTSSSSTN